MLDDENAGVEESCVDRPAATGSVIDIERINANQNGASLFEINGCIFGGEWVAFEVSVSSPVPGPPALGLRARASRYRCRCVIGHGSGSCPQKEREHMSPRARRTSHLNDRVSHRDMDSPDGMHVMLSR